jgi:uncharacterized protein
MNYLEIIHKYIPPESETYEFFIIHAVLVTKKALEIAQRLDLPDEQKKFIEEAAMLHDIGISKTQDFAVTEEDDLPYLAHITAGSDILKKEGLDRHALVAERHTGVGLAKEEIIKSNLPIPQRDFIAKSIEEKIISYADLFFSKGKKKLLFHERSFEEVEESLRKFGDEKVEKFRDWVEMFENN